CARVEVIVDEPPYESFDFW
nr:immunoglobulin heavy chain junction region [Macaca mulatta]MOV89325.1 immunoglobulin heavy chain junction region [Macaca mulatta]MOV89478.1 immunoglobulin heavy chain junction region [Macaca mulatta]MOV89629.1 immunoglobulin heavy chain junction region [Macaca mulatta]MOV91470.1 immunoglobulin heavy chain junction region [Macaca mulatta]